MKLQRRSGPLDDPFLSAVRRRHRDVDLVLLPPDDVGPDGTGPPESGPPPAPVEAAQERVALVGATLERLWRLLADEPGVTLRAREDALVAGPRVGAVEARSRLLADALDTGDGVVLLGRLAEALAADGWHVEHADGAVLRLSGAGAGQRLRATHARGSATLMLEVRSAPLDVGSAQAERLLGAAR